MANERNYNFIRILGCLGILFIICVYYKFTYDYDQGAIAFEATEAPKRTVPPNVPVNIPSQYYDVYVLYHKLTQLQSYNSDEAVELVTYILNQKDFIKDTPKVKDSLKEILTRAKDQATTPRFTLIYEKLYTKLIRND